MAGFVVLAQFQREGEVVEDAHVRVERVTLKHHRDVTVFRFDVVYAAVADEDVAAADLFEPRDHAQRRRFTAARRSDEDQKLVVRHVDRHVFYHDVVTVPLM